MLTTRWLDRRGVVTEGRVVDRKTLSSVEWGPTDRAMVAYRDGLGSEHSEWFDGRLTDPVEVEYDADQPNVARIPRERRSKIGGPVAILGLVFGLFLVVYNGTYLLGWWG